VRAGVKGLAYVAEGRLRLTGIGTARFSHHITLGLYEPRASGLEPARARILSQWTPVSSPLEQRGNVESGITADEPMATICYGDEDDGDSVLGFHVLPATVNR